jgi:hypothetical protein
MNAKTFVPVQDLLVAKESPQNGFHLSSFVKAIRFNDGARRNRNRRRNGPCSPTLRYPERPLLNESVPSRTNKLAKD